MSVCWGKSQLGEQRKTRSLSLTIWSELCTAVTETPGLLETTHGEMQEKLDGELTKARQATVLSLSKGVDHERPTLRTETDLQSPDRTDKTADALVKTLRDDCFKANYNAHGDACGDTTKVQARAADVMGLVKKCSSKPTASANPLQPGAHVADEYVKATVLSKLNEVGAKYDEYYSEGSDGAETAKLAVLDSQQEDNKRTRLADLTAAKNQQRQ